MADGWNGRAMPASADSAILVSDAPSGSDALLAFVLVAKFLGGIEYQLEACE